MQSSDLLGLVAGTFTTIAFIPQVVKSWRTRSTEDVSFGMFGLFSTGVALWLWYGVWIGSWPIVLANIFTLALSLAILYLKVRYK